MKRLPRWLAALPLSLAVHAAVVVIAVALLRTESTEPALILDLNAIIAGRDDGPGQAAQRAAPVAPSRSSAPRRPTPEAPPPSSARADAVDPRPAPLPEPVTPATPPPPSAPAPASQTTGADAPAPSQTMPSASAPATGGGTEATRVLGPGSADRGVAHDHASGGSAEGAAGARAGTGGDHVAAVAPGTGGSVGAGVASEYAAYLARLRQHIQESLRYPAAARRRGVSGTVQIEIAIAPDGAIATVSVVASSSHEILDRAAVDAARSLPRVPFPADVRPRALTVRLPVVFELQ